MRTAAACRSGSCSQPTATHAISVAPVPRPPGTTSQASPAPSSAWPWSIRSRAAIFSMSSTRCWSSIPLPMASPYIQPKATPTASIPHPSPPTAPRPAASFAGKRRTCAAPGTTEPSPGSWWSSPPAATGTTRPSASSWPTAGGRMIMSPSITRNSRPPCASPCGITPGRTRPSNPGRSTAGSRPLAHRACSTCPPASRIFTPRIPRG